jgi:DNA mismatch repair endonuclease MutH
VGFDYRIATRDEINDKARTLVGRRLIEIDPRTPMRPSSAQTKGAVGRTYETFFGIPPNTRKEADFPGAGIELKSVPIRLVKGEARAKERISLTMIHFDSLAGEQWETAAVRKKLDDLLLVFYEWDPLLPIARFKTLAAEVWRPDAESMRQMRVDWEAIRDLVKNDRRHEVSESATRLLGAATKGAGHGSTSRAWSLKQTFAGFIYQSILVKGAVPTTLGEDPGAAFERATLTRLAPHVGRSLADLATVVGREGKGGKAAAAQIVRALVGERGTGRHGEFERFGIETKIVPIDAAGRLVEAMSFPAFVHEELVFETWEASDLLARIGRMLIVPIHRGKMAPLHQAWLGMPFFWSPPPDDLLGIETEWERFRSLIEHGRALELPPASETTYLHVRPKGRDASDRDQAPGGIDVIKKCFWLNQSYLERVLGERGALTPPRSR